MRNEVTFPAQVADAEAEESQERPVSPTLPTPADLAWVMAIAAAKSAVIALAVDAFMNSSSPRYSGKGMRLRTIGYTGGLLLAPLAWRIRGRRDPYPRELDLAIALPLLVDAGGNAIGIYQRAHFDDLIHFADGALVSSLIGALATPRVRTPWEAAGAGVAASGMFAGLWEIGEWLGLKLGAKGMDLSYDDTMIDLAETIGGGVLGGLVTLMRHPTRLRRVPGATGDTVVELHGDRSRPNPTAAEPAVIDLGFVGHATVLLDVANARILTDPFLRSRLGPLERHGPPPDPSALGDIDVVLISHGHPDHFDRESLSAIPGRPVVIVPRGLGAAARRRTHGDVVEMTVGERLRFGDVSIEAVPARHWVTPGSARARPQGYVLDAGPRIWFAGDTGPLPPGLRPPGPIDVALLPVWTWGPHRGPGHLGPRSAAELLGEVDARVAVPIHWGTLYPRRLHRLWSTPLTEPGDRFAAHAARLAPQADVRVLRPRGTTTIRLAPAGRRQSD